MSDKRLSSDDKLIITRLSEKAKLPTREADSVGYDVYSYGDYVLNVGETKIIPLGFSLALPWGYGAFIWDRSSIGAKGIHVLGGVIDWGYRGQVKVILTNLSNELFVINHGMKIAQMVIQKCEIWGIEEISLDEYVNLPATVRGGSGFGSSDIPIKENKVDTLENFTIAEKLDQETGFNPSKWK